MESQSSCLKFDLWLFIQVLNKYCQHFPVLSTLAECWWDLDLLAGFTLTKMSKCKCQIVESMTIFYRFVLSACKWHMYIWRGESPVLMFRGRGDAQWEGGGSGGMFSPSVTQRYSHCDYILYLVPRNVTSRCHPLQGRM